MFSYRIIQKIYIFFKNKVIKSLRLNDLQEFKVWNSEVCGDEFCSELLKSISQKPVGQKLPLAHSAPPTLCSHWLKFIEAPHWYLLTVTMCKKCYYTVINTDEKEQLWPLYLSCLWPHQCFEGLFLLFPIILGLGLPCWSLYEADFLSRESAAPAFRSSANTCVSSLISGVIWEEESFQQPEKEKIKHRASPLFWRELVRFDDFRLFLNIIELKKKTQKNSSDASFPKS